MISRPFYSSVDRFVNNFPTKTVANSQNLIYSRLRLPWWAEGPAVGLGAVMLDMPYDIMGIKLVWWTWHDTDPNIYQR